MANPVNIASQYDEAEDVQQPAQTQGQQTAEPQKERTGKERRETTDRRGAMGYFRAHPMAKWIIAAALIVLILGGIFVWNYYAVRESTDDAQIDGHINPISPRVTGTVINVLHDDNEVVQAGTLLVEMDPKDYQVAVDRARADLANAQANSTAANVGVPLTPDHKLQPAGCRRCRRENRAARN